MSRARRRAFLVAGVVALLAAGACSSPSDFGSQQGASQELTGLCTDSTCDTTGSARRTTGLTSDTIGFQIGPGAGSVLIPSVPGHFSVLVRGHGTFSAELIGTSTAQHDIPKDYAWVDIGGDADAGLSDVRFSVANDGSELHMADLSVVLAPGNCSVAPAGPR